MSFLDLSVRLNWILDLNDFLMVMIKHFLLVFARHTRTTSVRRLQSLIILLHIGHIQRARLAKWGTLTPHHTPDITSHSSHGRTGPYCSLNNILKWCIYLSRSLFLYFNHPMCVTAVGIKVHKGACSKVLWSTSSDSYCLECIEIFHFSKW